MQFDHLGGRRGIPEARAIYHQCKAPQHLAQIPPSYHEVFPGNHSNIYSDVKYIGYRQWGETVCHARK